MTMHDATTVAATALGLSTSGALACLLVYGRTTAERRRIERGGVMLLAVAVLSLVGLVAAEDAGRAEVDDRRYEIAAAALRTHPALIAEYAGDDRLDRYGFETLTARAAALDAAAKDDAGHSGRAAFAAATGTNAP